MKTILRKGFKCCLSEKNKEVLIDIISLAFVSLFIYTAVSKFMTHNKFVWALKMSPYIGDKAEVLGWIIPVTELLISGLLIFEKSRRQGLIVSLSLMTLFTAYLIYMVATIGKLPCTCGGVISRLSWNQHIGFNLFFVGLAIAALGLFKKQKI